MILFKGTYASFLRERKVKNVTKHVKRFIYVRRKPGFVGGHDGAKHKAIVQLGGRSYIAALGRSGITAFKREGDGATPRASMRCLMGFWRQNKRMGTMKPRTALPIFATKGAMGWCDAVRNPRYNAPVMRPFNASHETLQRADVLYDCGIVLDWNITPNTGGRQRGRGSAIFLHVAKKGYMPTEGCIALRPSDLRHVVRQLNTRSIFKVV